MFEEENQLGLFEIAGADQAGLIREPILPPPSSAQPTPRPWAKPAAASPAKPAPRPPARPAAKKTVPPTATAAPAKKVSGLVPEGDVRLTANIRQDLHLKLKIASAHRRTTIGEIIEELIDAHL